VRFRESVILVICIKFKTSNTMRTLLLYAITLLTTVCNAQNVNIPDANFIKI